jgi:hypothetical protein
MTTPPDKPSGTAQILQAHRERVSDEEATEDERRLTVIIRAIVCEELAARSLTEEELAWARESAAAASRRDKLAGRVTESLLVWLSVALMSGLAYALLEYVRLKLGALGIQIGGDK